MNLEAVTKLAEDHWGYVQAVLEAHAIPSGIQRMCGFHYVSAFIHGYKHAVEDVATDTSNEVCMEDYDGYDWYAGVDYYNDMVAPVDSPPTQPVERPEVYGGGS